MGGGPCRGADDHPRHGKAFNKKNRERKKQQSACRCMQRRPTKKKQGGGLLSGTDDPGKTLNAGSGELGELFYGEGKPQFKKRKVVGRTWVGAGGLELQMGKRS